MRRLQDWPTRLNDYIDSRRDALFRWGDNDCASFAVGAVEAMTGERVPLPLVASELGAARVLRERAMADRVTDALGPPIPVTFAQRGDVALMLLGGRETLGVVIDAHVWGPGRDGALAVPRETATMAWRV